MGTLNGFVHEHSRPRVSPPKGIDAICASGTSRSPAASTSLRVSLRLTGTASTRDNTVTYTAAGRIWRRGGPSIPVSGDAARLDCS